MWGFLDEEKYRKHKNPVTVATTSSVIGYAHHMPVISQREERRNAIGIRTKKLLRKEIICAGTGLFMEIKYVDRTMFSPINGQAVKYSRSPLIA